MKAHRNIIFVLIAVIVVVTGALFRPVHVAAAGERLIVAVPTAAGTGEEITVTVSASSTDQAMNAVSGSLVFPGTVAPVAIRTAGSIVDFWTEEPHNTGGKITFEGVVLNPGYQGPSGTLFSVVFTAKKEGVANFYFNDAALLANDGLGSNILEGVGSAALRISGFPLALAPTASSSKAVALPVITEYSASVGPSDGAYVRGKGEPGALTKIIFKDVSLKSIGEQFIASVQSKRKHLDEVLVKNDAVDGTFEYHSPVQLVAGAYNATPFLVEDTSNTERPGLGVQLFVSDSELVRILVVLINVLALLIPIVGLGVLIYFIPWYSLRRMRVIRRKLGLEEDKLELSQHQLKRQDSVLDHNTEKILTDRPTP